MARRTSQGKCFLCGGTFGKGAMSRHLDKCRADQQAARVSKGQTPVFHIVAEGDGLPQYWVHFEVPAQDALEDLDHFLRRIWLECCGHLSAFYIGDTDYMMHEDPFEDSIFGMTGFAAPRRKTANMNAKLEKVLSSELSFRHEYDFGTTELKLKVVALRDRPGKSRQIEVLARNLPPAMPCSTCDNPAQWLCAQCIYEDTGLMCRACVSTHPCGEEMLMPITNSPRCGACAYDGELDQWPVEQGPQ